MALFVRTIVLVLGLILFASCARELTHHNLPFDSIVSSVDTASIEVTGNHAPLRALYLGCGHLVFQHQGQTLVFDPFFSTSKFLQKKIKSDSLAYVRYRSILARHQVAIGDDASVWLAHAHYDHMLDLPMLMEDGAIPRTSRIYGNESGSRILSNFIGNKGYDYHTIADQETYDPRGGMPPPAPVSASRSIRVLPILSSHAAHYKLIGPLKFHLMKGNASEKYFRKHYVSHRSETARRKWKEGKTYSFLVDFLDTDGKVSYRIFVQTSGSRFPKGNPPKLPDDHPVDVAFLCLASSNVVRSYPVKAMKAMDVQKVVYIHWEDFFLKPLDFDGAKLVRLTNFRRVNRKLIRGGQTPRADNAFMPRPGTMITIH